MFVEVQPNFTSARRREAQIKRWSRAKKQALIKGDYALLQRLSRSHD
jgi:putative endonuclease